MKYSKIFTVLLATFAISAFTFPASPPRQSGATGYIEVTGNTGAIGNTGARGNSIGGTVVVVQPC